MASSLGLSCGAQPTASAVLGKRDDSSLNCRVSLQTFQFPRRVSRSQSFLARKELSRSSWSRDAAVHAMEEGSSSGAGSVMAEELAKSEGGRCPGCGQATIIGGCNGEGRIQGGIGAVPGFAWWPIKAFRPCPAFIEAGGRYRRMGQSLDEVAFGGIQEDRDIPDRVKRRS